MTRLVILMATGLFNGNTFVALFGVSAMTFCVASHTILPVAVFLRHAGNHYG